MRDDPQILQRRLTAYVRPFPAKVLARHAGCTERTAENFRRGLSWPTARHWLRLVAIFGADITQAVFHPDAAAERISREIAELEAKLAERRADLRMVAQEGPRSGPRLAQAQRRFPAE